MGWIKLEKDLVSNPLFVMASARLEKKIFADAPASFDCSNALLGALARLWFLADTHISKDNVLTLGADQIDKVIGITGFCSLLPNQWLQIIDSTSVKLPNYFNHNGTIAKQHALHARRQAKYQSRLTRRRQQALTHHRQKNDADVSADKTRQDKTKKPPTPLPEINPTTVPGLDMKAWNDWLEYRRERKPSIRPVSMMAAAREMASYGSMQRAAVEHTKANGWQGLQPIKTNGTHTPAVPPNHSAELDALHKHAREIGFRDPYPKEAPGAYRTDMKMWEDRAPQYREVFPTSALHKLDVHKNAPG
jgi:hypothetical protein